MYKLPEYISRLVLGPLAVNTYIFMANNTLFIVDPGFVEEKLDMALEKNKAEDIVIINTHSHFDHIGANNYLFEKYKVKELIIHQSDADNLLDPILNLSSYMGIDYISKEATIRVNDGDIYSELNFIATPGHTKGSMIIRYKNILFTGDTLFSGSIGRTDLPGGNSKLLMDSLRNKIMTINEDLLVLPGHGEFSSIFKEKTINPFLKDL